MDGWKSEKLKVGKAISHIDVYRDVPRLIGLKKNEWALFALESFN